MSAVHNDYEQLRIFIDRLNGYLQTLDEANEGLDHAFAELGEAWNDQKRSEFEEIYAQLRQSFDTFKESTSEQIPYLQHMADILEQYSNLR